MKGARGCGLDFPKERQWPSGSGSDAMQSNGAARKIYKNTNAHTHTHTNTGKYRQQMDTHATWAEQAGSEVGGRVSGVRQQRTQDTGHWQLATHAKILPVGRRAPGTGSRDPRSPGPLLPILLQTILGTVAPSKPAGFSSSSIR